MLATVALIQTGYTAKHQDVNFQLLIIKKGMLSVCLGNQWYKKLTHSEKCIS